MLDKFKMSHLQGFVLFLFIAGVATALLYYYFLIDEASTYSGDSFACGQAFQIATLNSSVTSEEDAITSVKTYLEQHDVSIDQDELSTTGIGSVYRVALPNQLYEGNECTFRQRGQEPPACLGQWIQVNQSRLSMRYQVPCP